MKQVQNKFIDQKSLRFIRLRIPWKPLKWAFDLMVHWILSIARVSCVLNRYRFEEIYIWFFDLLLLIDRWSTNQPNTVVYELPKKTSDFVKLCIKLKKVYHYSYSLAQNVAAGFVRTKTRTICWTNKKREKFKWHLR